MATTTERAPARDRLLDAATELFYAEGVHTVGIDRIIERAGVAKASLYSTFGSKDELIRAYLVGRHEFRRQRIAAGLAGMTDPRQKLLAVFDVLSETFAAPGYHGCAFVNASAETSDSSPIVDAVDDYRGWVRGLFTELAEQAGAARPAELARQLHLLYDGAGLSARMDRDVNAAADARAVAEILIDRALAG